MDIKKMAEDLEMEYGEFMDLLGLFVEKSASDFNRLESSIRSGDVSGVVEASHSIKGAAGNLGIMKIYEIAKGIEMNGRCNNINCVNCEGAVSVLKEALDKVGHIVRQGV